MVGCVMKYRIKRGLYEPPRDKTIEVEAKSPEGAIKKIQAGQGYVVDVDPHVVYLPSIVIHFDYGIKL